MKRYTKWIAWMIAAATFIVLLVGLAAIGGIRYENSDDMLLVKGFMGFEGGEPVNFTLYTHTFLAWIFYVLSKAIPGVAWFSVFQLALLGLSVTVIVARSIQRKGVWGYVTSLVYLTVFAAFACARLSYTTTAALAGAACVWQLLALEDAKTPMERRCGLAIAVFLLLCAYSLRQMVALPVLAYCLLTLCWHGAMKRRIGAWVMVLMGTLAVFAGVRELEIDLREQRETLQWQQSRIELFDYTDFESDLTPALKADSGLTEQQVRLVQQWHFWDQDVDAEALQALTSAYAQQETTGVGKRLLAFARSDPRYLCAVVVLLLAVLGIVVCDQRPRFATLTAVLGVMGGTVMLLYLCWRGRVLFRGLDTILFPCGALLGALILRSRPPRKKGLAALLCVAIVATTGAHGLKTLDVLGRSPDWVSQQREAELETFARAHPEKLLVRTPNLLRDTRIFPDVSAGIPANTAIWGDWYCRMPGWHQQLEAFGFDGEEFTLTEWTNENILFATNEDAPPDVLLAAVSEALGREAVYELYGTEGTLRFFCIR